MKHLPSIAELRAKLGAPSDETVENVRLLKAFLKLSPRQRFEVIELVEQLLESLGSGTDGVDDANFAAELRRRSDEIDKGKAELVPWGQLKDEPF